LGATGGSLLAGLPKRAPYPKKVRVLWDWTNPSGPAIEPPLVNLVLRILVEDLRRRLWGDPSLEEKYLAGDEEVEYESLVFACALVGVAPEAYRALVEIDGALYQLHHWAVTEAICGPIDPGPYDIL
jgi:hypothetical protein